MDTKKNLELAVSFEEEIIKDRRALHQIPEVGFYLPESAAYIKERLAEMGIEGKDCGIMTDEVNDAYEKIGIPRSEGATGVVATIGQGEPCILLRADFDALPMEEKTGAEYASKRPAMHSCGHDTHAAMLLGAARILKERESELKGTVKLMFQIGEEMGSGSVRMIDDGLLENPKVDAAFAIHIQSQIPSGVIEYSKGIATASIDTWLIDIQGKGGHSSMPHKSIDPNLIANQIVQALHILPGREVDPAKSLSMAVTVLDAGSASNIIPDTAKITASSRSLDIPSRDHVAKRVEEIVHGTAKLWRGSASIGHFYTPSTYTDPDFVEEMLPVHKELFGEENVLETPPSSGAEDFGYITKEVPGMIVWLGAGSRYGLPLHNPKVNFDETMFVYGAALHASVAMDYLNRHGK